MPASRSRRRSLLPKRSATSAQMASWMPGGSAPVAGLVLSCAAGLIAIGCQCVAPTNTPVPALTNTPVPVATNTSVPDTGGGPTYTSAPVATNTSVPVATNTPVPNRGGGSGDSGSGGSVVSTKAGMKAQVSATVAVLRPAVASVLGIGTVDATHPSVIVLPLGKLKGSITASLTVTVRAADGVVDSRVLSLTGKV